MAGFGEGEAGRAEVADGRVHIEPQRRAMGPWRAVGVQGAAGAGIDQPIDAEGGVAPFLRGAGGGADVAAIAGADIK